MGQDMVAAAHAIEQQLTDRNFDAVQLVAALPASEAMALAPMAKRPRRPSAASSRSVVSAVPMIRDQPSFSPPVRTSIWAGR